jgi:hypothetical protein
MRIATIISIAACTVTALGGCASIKHAVACETACSGGAFGYFADKEFPGFTKSAQIYRAIVLADMISKVGQVDIRDAEDAEDFARHLNAFSRDIINANSYIVNPQPAGCSISAQTQPTNPGTPPFVCRVWFEQYLPRIEGDLASLAFAATHNNEFNSISGKITSGNYLGAIEKIAKVSGTQLEAAHYVAADYRSIEEIHAAVLQKIYSINNKTIPPCAKNAGGDNVQSAVSLISCYEQNSPYKTTYSWPSTSEQIAAVDAIFASAELLLLQDIISSCGQIRNRLRDDDQRIFNVELSGKSPAANGSTPTSCEGIAFQ